jgi:DNA-binding transcriptional LysR family regulator
MSTKSITKASEALYMTQPAVSIQLKKLQDQFDIPLIEVIGRQVYITDFGKEIGEIASRIVEEMETINFKTQAYRGIMSGKLHISAASTGKYIIPYFLSGFIEAHTGIDLTLDVTNKSQVVERLKANETDFAVVSVLPDNIKVEEEILLENKLYLVGNKPKKNKEMPLIYREEGSATRKAMEQYFLTGKAEQRKRIELTSNEAVKQAVMAGLGYSIVPLIGIQNEIANKQLYILPSKNLPISTEWRLIWLKGKKLSIAAEGFLDYVRTRKALIIDTHFKWCTEFDQN